MSKQIIEHPHTLAASKASATSKASAASESTLASSPLLNLFSLYASPPSPIDPICASFDQGLLLSPLPYALAPPQAHLSLPGSVRNSLKQVSSFFSRDNKEESPKVKEESVVWVGDRYAQFLAEKGTAASYIAVTEEEKVIHQENRGQKQEQKEEQKEQQKDQSRQESLWQNGREAKEEREVKEGNVDLLLAELSREKARKGVSRCHSQAMEIKLTELFDLLTEDDDLYLGLPLSQKIQQALSRLSSFQGQTLEGYLKLPLLSLLVSEFLSLRKADVQKQNQQRSVGSGERVRQKGRKGYSEPNSQRGPLREEDWIGSLGSAG